MPAGAFRLEAQPRAWSYDGNRYFSGTVCSDPSDALSGVVRLCVGDGRPAPGRLRAGTGICRTGARTVADVVYAGELDE